MDRAELIGHWQSWLWDQGIPSFPLFGITNGKCRCRDAEACRTPGKHPKVRGWRHLAGPYPVGALDNIGISTDSLVLVDIDTGDERPRDLPETFTVSTGRGLHLWYAANRDYPIRNSAGWRPGIDIRSVGGLAAAPPSRHVSGTDYTYLGGEIRPVPDVVLETQSRFQQRERKDKVEFIPDETQTFVVPVIEGLAEEIQSAPEGERNHTLFRCLCRFFEFADKGWAGADALGELVSAAQRNGLSSAEIATTIDSASGSLTN